MTHCLTRESGRARECDNFTSNEIASTILQEPLHFQTIRKDQKKELIIVLCLVFDILRWNFNVSEFPIY